MLRLLLFLFCLADALSAQPRPRLTVSPLQVAATDFVEVRGTGFAPNRRLISHLRRPDQSEYGVIWLLTNERGEFLHSIETLLLLPGTHDLWVVDDVTGATSNTVRFTVEFQDGVVLPEAQQALVPFIGVWGGDGILISLTGGNTGTVAGTIARPSLSCGAVLTFRGLYEDAIEFFETSNYGTQRCPGAGIVRIKLLQGGNLAFDWRHPTIAGTTTGILTSMR